MTTQQSPSAPATAPASAPDRDVQTPAALLDAPVLAHVVRGGFVESAHRGSLVAVAADGSPELVLGSGDGPVFPRSSNKPLQALAMVRSGLRLEPELLALACSSHSGEDFHLEGVRRILAGAGLTESDLQNTPDWPYDAEEQDRWRREGREKSSLAQNCSGKHAAMLATCVLNGWDTASYRSADHPLQQAMAATLEELAVERVSAMAVDGCGAPVMAVSLTGLARAFGRLAAAPEGTHERTVADAIRSHPAYLGGTRRDVTSLVRDTRGLIAKDGAEAVYAVGLADGRGLALKIADGGQRARPVVIAAALRRLGVESAAFEELERSPVLGHGETVGAVVAVGI